MFDQSFLIYTLCFFAIVASAISIFNVIHYTARILGIEKSTEKAFGAVDLNFAKVDENFELTENRFKDYKEIHKLLEEMVDNLEKRITINTEVITKNAKTNKEFFELTLKEFKSIHAERTQDNIQ